jgi:peptidoglycan/LPS O-acetylase OafA/YrhL
VVTTVCFYNTKEIWVPLGACGLLIFAEHSRACRWLTTAIPAYLGRISFSLYLVHGTVLWASMILLVHRVPFFVVVSVYLVCSIIIGHVFCVTLEEPAMRLGRRLTKSNSDLTAKL